MKIHDSSTEPQNAGAISRVLWFYCPGCECDHGIHFPQWNWNGSFDAPTFRPSLLCNQNYPELRCHSFITEGRIEFLTDSCHKLAGQNVEIPEWEGPHRDRANADHWWSMLGTPK